MSNSTQAISKSSLRARLCSIENANRLAVQVADEVNSDTAVVRTGNPAQPFRVVLANCAGEADIVSRTLNCGDQQGVKRLA
jgi:arginine/ornithine N-succinyltransferase beta subunit